eukprot:12914806-Prorocentrum_lima.AAC.1
MRYGPPKAGDVTAEGNHITYYVQGMITALAPYCCASGAYKPPGSGQPSVHPGSLHLPPPT